MCKKIHAPAHELPTWQRIIESEAAGHWFDIDAMRFFSSRISWASLTPYQDGYLFISSEDTSSPYFPDVRKYTLRAFDFAKGVSTIGDFRQFETLHEAKKALRQATKACTCGDCSDTPILQRPAKAN